VSQVSPVAHVPPGTPGRGWYVIALIVFLAGMAGMAAFLVSKLASLGDNLTQIVVPGEKSLALEAGGYTIFHELQSVIDGRIYASPSIAGLEVKVTGPGGETVPIAQAGIGGRYSIAGRTGIAAFDFHAPTAGTYVVTAGYADGASEPQAVLAVGGGFVKGLLTTIFGALAFAFGGAIIATVIAVRTLMKRRRAGLRF
jgi:hypothetical protein